MRKYIFIYFFTVILVYPGLTVLVGQSAPEISETPKNVSNPFAGDKSVIGYGAKLYKKHCWLCHGTNGVGNGPGAAEIATEPADFNSQQAVERTDGELFWWISNGGDDMQPFKESLTEEEIWKVVNYIRKVQNKI